LVNIAIRMSKINGMDRSPWRSSAQRACDLGKFSPKNLLQQKE
jgi:hypothetical protein